jgi:phage shock protein PspC (stress-responsive transcriptional regulator)
MMEAARESLIRRDDTFLGVCQALGEDFGFNPVLLRVAFALPVIFAPLAVIGVYLGLGVVVLISRLLAPRPKRKAVPQEAETHAPVPAEAAAAQDITADEEADQYRLPVAA